MNYYSNPKTYKQIRDMIQAAKERGLELIYVELTVIGISKEGYFGQWDKRPRFYVVNKKGEETLFGYMNTKKIAGDIKMMREGQFDWLLK